MSRYVALLRGINVGKAKRLPMADLRALLDELGYSNVKTLLNSGNAVFEAKGKADHAARISAAIANKLNLQVPVIVKSAKDIAAMQAENRLVVHAATDASRLLVAFATTHDTLRLIAAKPALSALPADECQLGEHALYLWCRDGILQSKAGEALVSKPGIEITTRNWATCLKIADLLNEAA